MIITIKYYGWQAVINGNTDFASISRDNGSTMVACGQLSNGANWYVHPMYSAPSWFYDILSIGIEFSVMPDIIPNRETEFIKAVSASEILSYSDAHVSIEF